MTALVRRVAAIACLALTLGGAATARANSADELRKWLELLEAQGAGVHVDGIESSADGASARALGLVIEAAPAAGQSARIRLSVGALSLTRAEETSTSFRVASAHADDLRLAAGDAYLKAVSADLKDVDLPRSVETALDPRQPTASLVSFVRRLFSAHAGSVRLAGVGWALPGASAEDVNSLASLSLDALDSGAIGSLRLRDLATSKDKGQAATRIADMSFEKVSPAILISIVDPQTYRVSASDRPWRAIVGHASLQGINTRSSASHTALQQIELGPVEVRQFSFDPTPILNLAAVNSSKLKEQPALAAQLTNGLADAIRVAKANVRDLTFDDGAEPPARRTKADAVELVELAPRGAKFVKVSGLQVQAGDGGVRAGLIAIDNVELPASAPISNSAGSATVPKFSNLALTDVVLVRPGLNATLGSATLAASDYIDKTPTRIEVTMDGLAVPVAELPASALKTNLGALKLDKLQLTAAVLADWQETSQELHLSNAQISAAGVGELSASAVFSGVPRDLFEHPEFFSTLAANALVQKARLSFRDAGLTGRVLDKFAEVNKVSVVKVRGALTSNMPTYFGAVGDAASRNRLIFAWTSFLNDPKSISVFTTVETPQPLMKVLDALRNSPQSLPGLLKLDAVANRSS